MNWRDEGSGAWWRWLVVPGALVVLMLLVSASVRVANVAAEASGCEKLAVEARATAAAETLKVEQARAAKGALAPEVEGRLRARLDEQAKRREASPADLAHAAVFGKLYGVGEGCLVMMTESPLRTAEGAIPLAAELLAGTGFNSPVVIVEVERGALVQAKEELALMRSGTPLLVAGALTGEVMKATLVADLRLATPATPAKEMAERLRPTGEWKSTPLAAGGTKEGMSAQAATTSKTDTGSLEFRGTIGGPVVDRTEYPNTVLVDIGLVKITLESYHYRAAALGLSYDFPFGIEVDTPNLSAGEAAALGLRIEPRSPGGDSVFGGLGYDVGARLRIDYPVFGPAFENPSASWGFLNSTMGAAPLRGETLDVPPYQCLTFLEIGLDAGLVGHGGARVSGCLDIAFHGADVVTDVMVAGGDGPPSTTRVVFGNRSRVGVNVTAPCADNLALTVTNVGYAPRLEAGVFLRAEAYWNSDYGRVDSPSVTLYNQTQALALAPPATMGFGFAVAFDRTPPMTSLVVRGTEGDRGWYRSDVELTLSATGGPGTARLERTEYSTDGSTWMTYGGPIRLSREGVTPFWYRSVGRCRVVEDARVAMVRVDKTPPVLTGQTTTPPNPFGWYRADVTVRWMAFDAVSGIDPAVIPGESRIGGEGVNLSASATVKDMAGNTTQATVGGIRIDRTPPMMTCGATPSVLWPANHKLAPVTTSVGITDLLSGANGFALDGVTSNEGGGTADRQGWEPGTPDTSGLLRAERLGGGNERVYALQYVGWDRAGNTATCVATVRVPHDQGH